MPKQHTVEDLTLLPPLKRPVILTIGTFDGVHLGHRVLLEEALRRARAEGGMAAALTFRNHPRAVVAPENCPALLTGWEEKRELILATGVELLVGLWFDEILRRQEPEAFIRETLLGRLQARTIISGPNFHFGFGGRGNPALLRRMAAEEGFEFHCHEPVHAGEIRVSSTGIRQALLGGEVALAARLLGRRHRIAGRVVTGDRLGRTIGFPTANLELTSGNLLPADGVYAVVVRLPGGKEQPGMMNLGWRPTVNGNSHRLEVHLIDFEGELGGSELEVFFVERLRGEERFNGLGALREQLHRDRDAAVEALREAPGAASG